MTSSGLVLHSNGHVRRRQSQSLEKSYNKRTKLEMALAELADISSELREKRSSNISARRAEAIAAAPCSQCPVLIEQMRKSTNERTHWQRKCKEATDKLATELAAQQVKYEKKHDKAVLGAARNAEYLRDDVIRLKKEKENMADDLRTTTRTMKDYRKEFVAEKIRNEKLTEAVAATAAEMEALRERVVELEKFKSEIEREIETSSDEGQSEEPTAGNDEVDGGAGATGPSGI